MNLQVTAFKKFFIMNLELLAWMLIDFYIILILLYHTILLMNDLVFNFQTVLKHFHIHCFRVLLVYRFCYFFWDFRNVVFSLLCCHAFVFKFLFSLIASWFYCSQISWICHQRRRLIRSMSLRCPTSCTILPMSIGIILVSADLF